MNDRLRFFKWRAIARQMADTSLSGTPEYTTALQFRDGLDSAMIRHHDDRRIQPPGLGRGALYHVWLTIKSRPINLRPLSLVDMINPANVPQADWRIAALVNLFNALSAGTQIVTPAVQRAFHHAAESDPDARVRAWALFLLDPENYPRPTDTERGE